MQEEIKCGFYHPETGKECHLALAFPEEYTDADNTYFLCEQNPNCSYKELQKALKKIKKVEKLAKYYAEICNGAGGQSMNVQDRHLGMCEVGREILELLKKE